MAVAEDFARSTIATLSLPNQGVGGIPTAINTVDYSDHSLNWKKFHTGHGAEKVYSGLGFLYDSVPPMNSNIYASSELSSEIDKANR